MHRLLCLSLSLAALVACNPQGAIPDGAEETVTNCLATHRDPVDLVAARVEQDMLWLDMLHGGGCGTHTFYTCWNGTFENDTEPFNEANPPRVEVTIGHDANNDTCEAGFELTAGFALTEVRDAYLNSHDEPGNRLVIAIDGTTVQYPLD